MIDRGKLKAALAKESDRFIEEHPKSKEQYRKSGKHLLGGVPMAWMKRWPGPFPLFARSASGATVIDVDGHSYIDFALGDTGAMTGHAPAYLTDAIIDQSQRAITTMMPSEDAIEVAKALSDRFELDKWQFALSATDANRFALRLARFVTKRTKILVFDWCYHGTVDETLVTGDESGKVIPRLGNTTSAFDPAQTTKVVQFNDLFALEEALCMEDVAAVLTEPALTNIGIVLPEDGFHEKLRELCTKYGTLLIIDETHTICVGPGGYGRQFGLKPDLLTIGKPIGGGIPSAAFGMTGEVASQLEEMMNEDSIDVSGIGGTLTANAFSLRATRATLANSLSKDHFEVSIPLARSWADGVKEIITRYELDWSVQNLGSRSEYWFCPAPRNGREAALAIDPELERYFHLFALNRSILLTPFHNMALFSPYHTSTDVERHTEVFRDNVESIL